MSADCEPLAISKLIWPGVCPGVINASTPGIGSSPSSKILFDLVKLQTLF